MTSQNIAAAISLSPQRLSPAVRTRLQNPYTAFIESCQDDSSTIKERYVTHRTQRNAQQKALFLAEDGSFPGLSIDQYLLRLERPTLEPGFRDERNCLVFWARPPIHILELATEIQGRLKEAAPQLMRLIDVWLMPPYRMHMTTLEVAFSKTPNEIADLINTLRPEISSIASYTHTHRARLVKPMVSYDLSAFALSFLPAHGEERLSSDAGFSEPERIQQGDEYTYHHLRRDIFDKVAEAGLHVGSRYQVPSAHITMGRYLEDSDHDTPELRRKWIDAIDEVNEWLERSIWGVQDGRYNGEWIVGQEKGLDARCGTLWYGGGRTILMGEGF